MITDQSLIANVLFQISSNTGYNIISRCVHVVKHE